MATFTIPTLAALTAPASDDLFAIWDTTASTTKKISITNLFQNIPVNVSLLSAVAWKPTLVLENTTDDNTGPAINLINNRANPADNDIVGYLLWKADSDAHTRRTIASIWARAADVSDGNEDLNWYFQGVVAGTNRNLLNFYAASGWVFNDDGIDLDFRVEASGVTNALFVQGSDGGVIMGGLKSGATAGGAGAASGELWITSSHATLPDGVCMIAP